MIRVSLYSDDLFGWLPLPTVEGEFDCLAFGGRRVAASNVYFYLTYEALFRTQYTFVPLMALFCLA